MDNLITVDMYRSTITVNYTFEFYLLFAGCFLLHLNRKQKHWETLNTHFLWIEFISHTQIPIAI